MQRFLFVAAVLTALLPGQEYRVGSKVNDFSIRDLKGSPVQLSSLRGDVTVITFIATQCPVSNAYNDRMNAVYRDYAPKGVKFVFINANHTEPAAEVERHARAHAFAFPVYKDDENAVADRFGAQVTPEAFILDKDGVIRYHGPIDDSQIPARVQKQHVRNALDAMLAGKSVSVSEAKAFGCSIKRAKKAA
jgi:peroxiredoxin